MTDTELAAALASTISLVGILVFFWLYRDYSVDRFRQQMFVLRDEVFDFASSGGIKFDHPAYGMLRFTINGFTRWADELRLLEILMFIFMSRRGDWSKNDGFDAQWTRTLVDLDSTTRERLIDYRERMHRILISYLVLGSPVLFATLIVPVTAWVAGVQLTNVLLRVVQGLFDGIDAVACDYGERPMAEGWSRVETSASA